MPVVLLLLGLVTFGAGVALAVPGITFRDGTFDTEVVTPGLIAVVGGLLLIGMGLVVRLLQRIERALAARPAALAVRTGDVDTASAVTGTPDVPKRIPFPPKPQSNPQSASAGKGPEASEDAALESLRVKFPSLARLEGAEIVEVAEVSLMPKLPVRPEQEVGATKSAAAPPRPPTRLEQEAKEIKNPAAAGRGGNGATPARVAPRFDFKARPAALSGGTKGPALKTVAATQTAPLPVPVEPEPANETAVEAPPVAEAPQPASVLKSGVVEGMAYTLYSDGSIEAQLPQGTLRFGSITALRHHLENAS